MTELPQRAAALSITPALLAANVLGQPVVSVWVRSRAHGPVVILNGGFDLGPAQEESGLRRLAAPATALARPADGPAWAALLDGPADRKDAAGDYIAPEPDTARWQWLRYTPVFDPLSTELAGESTVAGLRGAMRGSVEDCFELLAAQPLAWLIHAHPVPDAAAGRELTRLAHLMPGLRNRAGSAESHKLALERAEAWFREISTWRPNGWWQVDVYVGACDESVAHQAAAALTGAPELRQSMYTLAPVQLYETFAASPDIPDGNQGVDRPGLAGAPDGPEGWGSAYLLASLTRPPVREVPGVRVVKAPRFDLTAETAGPVQIGELLDANLLPCGQWSIPLSSLNRHAFVCGATGSGKSQTIRILLEALSTAEKRVPWLVIEPAKAEYAGLAARLPADQDVVVLRPGDPDLIPGGLNPLEPEPGFGLQTHIDLVQALFMAAFEADEPFPQVLSRALVRCYQDRRWNLGTGEPAQSWRMHSPQHPPAWPSLSDLQAAARQVVDDIGYGREVADNVRGFIDVRIGSLRLGSPGRFFEGGHPLDIGALLEQNVVIELEGLGSDADKAFLIGIVLIRLVEHLRVHRAKATSLMHLTVIEEAHRLLKNMPPGSPAAQAVSLFADLLAEIRAYGEGIAVVEQIPSKIISDVVKNSAVKVMHRLPATDDRDFVGATMNLDDAGSEYVVTLRPGMAVVHADGMDRPCLVHARNGEVHEGGTPAFVPPRATSRHRECGSMCSASSAEACTLRQISTAEELAAALPELTLWLEAELITHLIGGGYKLPVLTGTMFEQLRALDPRTVQCTVASVVHGSIDARYGPLAEFYDPGLLGEHLSSAAIGAVDRCRAEAPCWPATRQCDRSEPEFQAGQRRFIDLLEELGSMEPGAVIPNWLAQEGRRRGASRLGDRSTAAQALEVLRNHRWATYAGQQTLYWGAGPETPLTGAIRALAGSAEARDRTAVFTALKRLEMQPPEWLVSRLCPQEDVSSTEG
ncbi:ATP-binding protein [Streptomyces kaniharaensis]|uniref:ATP-binding protein n=1 Tax=Streptomyces kaniharaensis TaxID=212423 RepID=UPI0018A8548D|nr:ATP-binding protein [Streptomyces kaniharaensis]